MKKNQAIEKIISYIETSKSPYQCVNQIIEELENAKFCKLSISDSIEMKAGKKYVIDSYGSSCFAVSIGKKVKAGNIPSLRIITSHTDWPTFLIKPNPEVKNENYGRLNTEPYGGAIYSSWLDRPLGIAGKVCLKTTDPFEPEVRLFDSERPVAIIPGLAIHMDRNINEGFKLNPQSHLLPLVTMLDQEKNGDFFLDYLANSINCKKEDILDFELNLYNCDDCSFVGMNKEYLSGPRLDNITSVTAALIAIEDAKINDNTICVSAFYHNEEIGSRTKQGADSTLTANLLERIFISLGYTKADFLCALSKGLCLSFDVAHGMHPAFPEKNDITNKISLGDGIVIKQSARQSYATDSTYVSIVQGLCEKEKIPYCKFVNRSDVRGGSTLGNIVSASTGIPCVDIGVPILSMHSARELMACKDQESITKLALAFYQA